MPSWGHGRINWVLGVTVSTLTRHLMHSDVLLLPLQVVVLAMYLIDVMLTLCAQPVSKTQVHVTVIILR